MQLSSCLCNSTVRLTSGCRGVLRGPLYPADMGLARGSYGGREEVEEEGEEKEPARAAELYLGGSRCSSFPRVE